MEIEINGQTIKLRQSFRSYMSFENIAGKPFGINSISDVVLFFYCTVMASKRDIDLELDTFVDWLDEHNGVLGEFTEWMTETDRAQSALSKKAPEGETPAPSDDGSKKKE